MFANTVILKKVMVKLQVKETVFFLSLSVALPFIIHLIPTYNNIPAGAIFLPIFYAPFIAIILFRPHVAILTALFAPVLNRVFTGSPVWDKILFLNSELLLFALFSYLLARKLRNFWGVAPVAYLLSKLSVFLFLKIFSGSGYIFFHPVITAMPGIVILLLINIFLVKFKDKQFTPN